MAAAEPVMSLSAPTAGEPTERLAGPGSTDASSWTASRESCDWRICHGAEFGVRCHGPAGSTVCAIAVLVFHGSDGCSGWHPWCGLFGRCRGWTGPASARVSAPTCPAGPNAGRTDGFIAASGQAQHRKGAIGLRPVQCQHSLAQKWQPFSIRGSLSWPVHVRCCRAWDCFTPSVISVETVSAFVEP